MKKVITSLEEIKKLPLGTKLYQPTISDVEWWYYAGINPMTDNSIMLVSSYNIQKLEGKYIGDKDVIFYTNYDLAKEELLKMLRKM